jgi:hypothetical protein
VSDDDLTRRELLNRLAIVPLALSLHPTVAAAQATWARISAARAAGPYTVRFFTPHEWQTVRLLADYIIPRDERSGSASDAGVPEFLDFIMVDKPAEQVPMRGGLRWLDSHCHDRFGGAFVKCTAAQQTSVLDEISWPARAEPAVSQGVAFFSRFRDLTASGFWTSRMGITDLQYMGNTVVPEWHGCPPAALQKLGVEY